MLLYCIVDYKWVTVIMDDIKFKFNDMILLHMKNDSDRRRFASLEYLNINNLYIFNLIHFVKMWTLNGYIRKKTCLLCVFNILQLPLNQIIRNLVLNFQTF